MPTSLTHSTPPAAAHIAPLPPPTQTAGRGWLIVRLALGTLLVVAAVLKMSGGSGEALRSALPFVSPRLYASGVMAEFILGVWLLSGLAPAWSWLCALGFFGLLAEANARTDLSDLTTHAANFQRLNEKARRNSLSRSP